MRPAIEAVRSTNQSVAEVALCYTGNLLDPAGGLYTLDYYLHLAEEIVDAGVHVLAIKDMAGLLRAPAAAKLVTALRERFYLPVHLHTHDTAGGQLATLLSAIRAGVDAVDVATASVAGLPVSHHFLRWLRPWSTQTMIPVLICMLSWIWSRIGNQYGGYSRPLNRVYQGRRVECTSTKSQVANSRIYVNKLLPSV